uniref:Uncharacterized protein n=1 Tax=Utricularia reniformis TaxID=192314 RepID=A0A1Y0AZB2_9LAMI|nr:hypothetical protein AEK19_MT0200 [Utricularia reniformis]ART30480.1 hypothetical protein AEK19_MT0200 [Utricularia reniformis]
MRPTRNHPGKEEEWSQNPNLTPVGHLVWDRQRSTFFTCYVEPAFLDRSQ